MPHPDVIIVGAGLAGLTCARHLQQAGLSCTIFEASDGVGGRVRTDHVDGYTLDRGFQVLLTAYPETQRALDYEALDLGTFYSGALVRSRGRFHRVADPFQEPSGSLATLQAPVGSPADKLRVARLRLALLRGSLEDQLAREEVTTLEALRRRWGFSEGMIDTFFRPFLGGILLDRELEASSRMFEFVFRMFALGPAALPAGGMQTIPERLADELPEDAIHLGTRVAAAEPGTVTLEDGTRMEARAVVVATHAPEAARLTDAAIPTAHRSVATLYYAAADAPIAEPILVLDGDGEGPINNLTVLTNAVPSYAPEGRALLSVSVLGNPTEDDDALEAAVRAQLRDWFGRMAARWDHLRTYRIRYALPDQAPPFLSPPERPVRLERGLYLCGDHRATASIHGAMASGRRAAEALQADLPAEAFL